MGQRTLLANQPEKEKRHGARPEAMVLSVFVKCAAKFWQEK